MGGSMNNLLYSVETDSFFPSRAAISVCQAREAHLTRTGNSHTPEKTSSLSRPSELPVPVTIAWNLAKSASMSAFDLPLTASLMSDADAVEIAQPAPFQRMSSTLSPVFLTLTEILSPQRGLSPEAEQLGSSSRPALRGIL